MGPLPQRLLGMRVEYLAGLVALALMAPTVIAPRMVSYPVDVYCAATPGCEKIYVTGNNPTAYGQKFQQVWDVETTAGGSKVRTHHHHHYKMQDASSLSQEQMQITNNINTLADKHYSKFAKIWLRLDDPLIFADLAKRGTK